MTCKQCGGKDISTVAKVYPIYYCKCNQCGQQWEEKRI